MLSQTVDGAKLRSFREKACIPVADLAEAAGCTIWHIYGIETGKHQPSYPVYVAMKDALGADDKDLLVEEEAA